jgi:hypothetical protein
MINLIHPEPGRSITLNEEILEAFSTTFKKTKTKTKKTRNH